MREQFQHSPVVVILHGTQKQYPSSAKEALADLRKRDFDSRRVVGSVDQNLGVRAEGIHPARPANLGEPRADRLLGHREAKLDQAVCGGHSQRGVAQLEPALQTQL